MLKYFKYFLITEKRLKGGIVCFFMHLTIFIVDSQLSETAV